MKKLKMKNLKMKNFKTFFVVLSAVIALALSGCQNPFLQLGEGNVSSGASPTGSISPAEIKQGTGTSIDPFVVYDVATLKRVGTEGEEEGEWGLTKHYRQIADIDMGKAGNWVPIGSDVNPFSGSYKGGDKTISNLNCSYGSGSSIGLFGCISSSGVVEHLGLLKPKFQGEEIGGIAHTNGGIIQNCFVKKGKFTGMTGMGGGIAGNNERLVRNCFFDGDLDGALSGTMIGGIAGKNDDTVENCYSSGSYSGIKYIGGISGYNTGIVLNCYSLSEVGSLSATFVGGIVDGRTVAGAARNCVALSEIIYGDIYYGRISGCMVDLSFNYARSDMILNDVTTIGLETDLNGKDITASEYEDIGWWKNSSKWATGEAWDFDNVWAWDAVKKLPILRNVGGQ